MAPKRWTRGAFRIQQTSNRDPWPGAQWNIITESGIYPMEEEAIPARSRQHTSHQSSSSVMKRRKIDKTRRTVTVPEPAATVALSSSLPQQEKRKKRR